MTPAEILRAWERAAGEPRDDLRRELLAVWALRHGRELAVLAFTLNAGTRTAASVIERARRIADLADVADLAAQVVVLAFDTLTTSTCAGCGAHLVTRPDGERVCSEGCEEER